MEESEELHDVRQAVCERIEENSEASGRGRGRPTKEESERIKTDKPTKAAARLNENPPTRIMTRNRKKWDEDVAFKLLDIINLTFYS